VTVPAAFEPGYELPTWVRAGTLHHWNRYAAVNDEFADHHMADEGGQHEGFPAAFIMGPLEHDYLHAMLRSAIGDEGRIVKVDMRLRNPLLRGRTLTAGGAVTALRPEGSEVHVDIDVWERDDEGLRLTSGTATVAFEA
jgi:hypothetical protein